MHAISKDMAEFRRQLKIGSIPRAYRALLSYMAGLRVDFENNLGGSAVSGLYQGSMDVTFFAVHPSSLKRHNLKVAIVFNYEAFGFEAWLAGRNRAVQRHYWKLFKDNPWPEYRVVAPAVGVDAILECDLAKDFDLAEPEVLTARIEMAALGFIADIERFLDGQDRRHEEPTERKRKAFTRNKQ